MAENVGFMELFLCQLRNDYASIFQINQTNKHGLPLYKKDMIKITIKWYLSKTQSYSQHISSPSCYSFFNLSNLKINKHSYTYTKSDLIEFLPPSSSCIYPYLKIQYKSFEITYGCHDDVGKDVSNVILKPWRVSTHPHQ